MIECEKIEDFFAAAMLKLNCQAVSGEKLYKIKFADKENVNMKPIEIMKRRAAYLDGVYNGIIFFDQDG